MSQVKQIQKRIKSIKNIGHITKAMKALASSQIKKLENAMKIGIIYEEKMREILNRLLPLVSPEYSPLIKKEEVPTRFALIILTSDTGFCGSFNQNIIRSAMNFIQEKEIHNIRIFALGKKIISYLKRHHLPWEIALPQWKPDIETARQIIFRCTQLLEQAQIHQAVVFYSSPHGYHSASKDILFPVSIEQDRKDGDFIVEPPPEESLNFLLPLYLNARLLRRFLETRTGELESRLRSMTNASENAEKLTEALTLKYFKARQDGITQELMEIIGGSEAVK